MQQNKDEVIKQGIQTITKRLSQKQELLSKQEAREECMQRKMQNTKDDIEQLSYTLHELEKAQKAKDTRRVIPHDEILRFFTRFCHLFDDLQHRYHKSLKYWLTSLLIYTRYRFRSRTRTPGHEFLRPATILTYFKYERGMFT